MPFQMKVLPIDAKRAVDLLPRSDPVRPAAKSRLKRLFERQFPSVLKPSLAEKPAGAGDEREKEKEEGVDVEPNSVCLDNMVFSFIEGGNHEKPPRGRCICFNANFDDSSDDEFDADVAPPVDVTEAITSLVPCASVAERNLLADASKILEKTKSNRNKGVYRRFVADGLRSLGYDAAICKSRWEKNPSFPAGDLPPPRLRPSSPLSSLFRCHLRYDRMAGEYEYIDVVIDGASGHRLLVDIDFKSEFEVARPTKSYRAVLQHLPSVFVGRPDRLQRIVALASEAARQSLKKKGLHVPPWRRPEYMRAKWLSPHQRTTAMEEEETKEESVGGWGMKSSCRSSIVPCSISFINLSSEFKDDGSGAAAVADETVKVAVSPWKLAPARPKTGVKVVAGLALVL